MPSTGDPEGNLALVRRELRKIKCPLNVSEERLLAGDPKTLVVGDCQPRLLAGDPKEFIPLFRYVLLVYSQPLKDTLFGGAERPEDWDACRFADAVFRVCRDKLNLHPSLNLKQFLSQGFSERKLILLVDLTPETTDVPASPVPAPCHGSEDGPSVDPVGSDSHQDVLLPHQVRPSADVHVPSSLGSTKELVQAVRNRCHS
eukprot:CAMPEP_0113930998 /NCGR_PEP_ID=MMETSP1159-20121227/6281_1 /TAXON_ID=88271 /ORGANISM="Picocystis salinarum" /LENGTH=200 /DNA_ID=CAMNT_0000931883 /DNA_START=35 /DNA_END=634 /DNA_ORIENTATION=+ /assembly_acc=CAM_ASM_000767